MAEARYLFRLDDACPWMDRLRWGRIEEIFDRNGVKPIVAVVPDCHDPALQVNAEDPLFWDRARQWQSKGWTIGLHGYDHVFKSQGKGLVPLNSQTEFAGRPEAEQREKIKTGWKVLGEHGLVPQVWVAPAHTFDKTTLRCLVEETPIRIISDGLSSRPFRRYGVAWIPQQVWKPRQCPPGVWTICLHPNEMDEDELLAVEAFVGLWCLGNVSFSEITSVGRSWGVSDWLFEITFRLLRGMKRWFKKAK